MYECMFSEALCRRAALASIQRVTIQQGEPDVPRMTSRE